VNRDHPPDETPDDAEPAHILSPNIPYVRGWAHAARTTTALEAALRHYGLREAFPYLRAEVNVYGIGMVELGRITPETAHALATLLSAPHATDTPADKDASHGSAA
jgi:hypothetical protein